MKKKIKKIKRFSGEFLLLMFGIIYASPILLLFMNTFKTQGEMFESFLSFPKALVFTNYIETWQRMHYPRALINTLLVTVGSVFVIILVSSMAAYRIARIKSKKGSVILIYFIVSMMLPFQTIMIPIAQITSIFKLNGSFGGYILVASALFCPFTIYLYRGFCRQIPIEIEEAAKIDGAGSLKCFFTIIFPLLKPTTVTAIILNVMNVWNDYVLASIMLMNKDSMTLQLSVMQYTGSYNLEWNLTLATLAIAILPVIILYLFLQEQIQGGMVAGSLKG